MNGTKQFRFPSSSKGITVRISDNTKCNVRQSGGGSALPGSSGSRHGRRNGPLDRDQKSNAKQNSRNNHGRDRAHQSTGGGSGQNQQSQQHTQGKSGNHPVTPHQSFDIAAQSHARVAGLAIDHPPQSSQSQHAGNSLLIPPQSTLMANIPASSSNQTAMMTHNGSMNPNPLLA